MPLVWGQMATMDIRTRGLHACVVKATGSRGDAIKISRPGPTSHCDQLTTQSPIVTVCLPALNRYRAAAQINDFRIFVCHFRRKRNKKRKRKVQFYPKTKMAETIKSRHFRGRKRKRKRISVGLH